LVEFRVLGPVDVFAGGCRVNAGHARQRAVLAVLVLELGRVVPAEVLVDRVWGEEPPRSVRNALQGNVSRLRMLTAEGGEPPATLARRAGGYVLEAAPEQVDLQVFRGLVAQAGAAGGDERAAGVLRRGLGLWQGGALGGVASPWLDGVREALEQERRAALGDLYDIELRLGRHAAVAGELSEAAVAHPADERLVGLLMLALYRSGRAAGALRWFERACRGLAEELGTDPGPELRRLHQQVLRADPALDWRDRAGTATDLASGPAAGGGADLASGPAAGGKGVVPRELPGDVAAFTGRAAELATLDRLLADPAEGGPAAVVISAVSGTAGVGKTALAVRWAHRAADRFPDGQLYVNLRGYDPGLPLSAADALAGLLRSLGVAGTDMPPGEDGRMARFRSLLAGRRMLLVLDNAADSGQVRPLLPGSPHCRVVVTSRDALAGLVARDGARKLDLDLLPEQDAVRLLRAVIGPSVDEDPPAARLLAGQCARLPLALRVAAELAVTRPGLPVADLAGELADEQRRLELLDAGGDPHTAVRAVFSWSCRHLDDATVQGFARLGLHPGPDFELYAAAALADITQDQARRLLDTLSRTHLIQPSQAGPGRYVMHDLLRAYARDLAVARAEDDQQAALTRLLDHYLAAAAAAMNTLYPAERYVRPAVPRAGVLPPMAGPKDAQAWMEAQMACLVTATALAAGHGWPSHATRLAQTVSRQLEAVGHHPEAVIIHSHAIRAAREVGDRAAQANALVSLAAIDGWHGHQQRAADRCEQAVALAGQAGDLVTQSRALANLGNADLLQSRYQQAVDRYQQALAIDREIGNLVGQCRSLGNIGCVLVMRGRCRQALGPLEESLAIAREIGHHTGEGHALTQLGEAESALGHYQQAASYFGQCLANVRRRGDRFGEAYALSGLGRVEARRGRRGQAAMLLEQALALHREIGSQPGAAEALNHLGEFLLSSGQPDQARDRHAEALTLSRQIGDEYEVARGLAGLASCFDSAGQQEQAIYHWREALAIYTSIGAAEADRVRARLRACARRPTTIP
jgi:DNA-binding SARP family transcriptional activator/tetratricopeptide (TPR) repeat protein